MQRFLMACALSFIWSLVSLEMGAYWWVGLIGGFVAGYIGYDARGAVNAVSRAWAVAQNGALTSRLPKERLRLCCYLFGAGASTTLSLIIFFFILGMMTGTLHKISFDALGVFSLLMSAIFAIPDRCDNIASASKWIMVTHPILLFFWHIPRGFIWAIARIPAGAAIAYRFCSSFICTTFKYVHSNARLLFGIDVAIGVAVGYYTGSALIGGLAGGAWWLLDWHLISVKVMGLKAA